MKDLLLMAGTTAAYVGSFVAMGLITAAFCKVSGRNKRVKTGTYAHCFECERESELLMNIETGDFCCANCGLVHVIDNKL